MKFWNVGLNTTENRRIGFIVCEDTLDAAVNRARNVCAAKEITLEPGSMAQVRDDSNVGNNEYFELMYQFMGTLV